MMVSKKKWLHVEMVHMQQLLTSCRNSSLLLVKLTIDYLSFIRIEKKSGDYFMEGSLQPCNYNIY